MTVPAPGERPAGGLAEDRAAAAWLADLQQDLIAPVHAVRELAGMILEDARPAGPSALTADLSPYDKILWVLIDDLVSLGVQGAAGIPIGEAQQRRHRQGEQRRIQQHDAEGLGPDKP